MGNTYQNLVHCHLLLGQSGVHLKQFRKLSFAAILTIVLVNHSTVNVFLFFFKFTLFVLLHIIFNNALSTVITYN